MNLSMTTDEVRKLLGRAVQESLIEIPEGAPLTDFVMERSVNHGIWKMFYRIHAGLVGYETGKREEGKGNDDCGMAG